METYIFNVDQRLGAVGDSRSLEKSIWMEKDRYSKTLHEKMQRTENVGGTKFLCDEV